MKVRFQSFPSIGGDKKIATMKDKKWHGYIKRRENDLSEALGSKGTDSTS